MSITEHASTMSGVSMKNWDNMSPQRQATWIAITKWQLAPPGTPQCFNAAEEVDAAIDKELSDACGLKKEGT